MRKEIRRIIRQIEQSVECPKCEIDTETIKEEFSWNGAIRYLKCPDCGYEFQVAFKIAGKKFQANVISPDGARTMDVDLTDEEQDYLRQALGNLKPT
ncbi:MAG: hypothetical protein ACETVU_03660 [Desulfatiglandales bacterium]